MKFQTIMEGLIDEKGFWSFEKPGKDLQRWVNQF